MKHQILCKTPVLLFVAILATAPCAGITSARAQSVMGFDPNSTAINNWRLSNLAEQARLIQEAKRARGRELIRTKRATTAFVPRELPLQIWFKKWGVDKDADKRRVALEEWKVQKALYNAEVNARGANPRDGAQVWAIAFMMAYEAYSGQRANAAQFKDMVASWRSALLQMDTYQGDSNLDKQELAEDQIVSSTNALRLRRLGTKTGEAATLAEARKQGADCINGWWHGGANNLRATPTKFVSSR